MIEINILPEESKRRIKTDNIYSSTKKMFLVLTLMVLFLSTILLLARIALKYQVDAFKNFSEIYEASSSTSPTTKNIEDEVIMIKKIQADHIDWYETIANLTAVLDGDIIVESISIDKDTASLSIGGVAKTREALLKLKANLEGAGKYSSIDFPVKTLLEKENIKFDIKMNIKFI